MTLDSATLHLLQYQGRRMHACLTAIPPDRKEALRIQERVDTILDARPRHDRVLVGDETIVVNATGQAEVVTTSWEMDQLYAPRFIEPNPPGMDRRMDDNPPGSAAGGIGLLDRP